MNKKFISGLALAALVSFSMNAFAQEASTAKKGTAAPQTTQTEPTASTAKKAGSGRIKTILAKDNNYIFSRKVVICEQAQIVQKFVCRLVWQS